MLLESSESLKNAFTELFPLYPGYIYRNATSSLTFSVEQSSFKNTTHTEAVFLCSLLARDLSQEV